MIQHYPFGLFPSFIYLLFSRVPLFSPPAVTFNRPPDGVQLLPAATVEGLGVPEPGQVIRHICHQEAQTGSQTCGFLQNGRMLTRQREGRNHYFFIGYEIEGK